MSKIFRATFACRSTPIPTTRAARAITAPSSPPPWFRNQLYLAAIYSPYIEAIGSSGGYAEGAAWAVEISGRHPLTERYSISAGLGHYGLNEVYHDSYNYWNLTLTATLKPFEIQLAYLGVSENAEDHFTDDSVGDRVALTALWRFRPQISLPGTGPRRRYSCAIGLERSTAVALKSVESQAPRAPGPGPDASERELLERVAKARDQAAFRTLYGNYYQRLSRLLARMSVRREDIEEVINDTFWVIWTKAGEFRGASQLSTWIIGIAYRRALNALRRAKIRPVSDEPSTRTPSAWHPLTMRKPTAGSCRSASRACQSSSAWRSNSPTLSAIPVRSGRNLGAR